uniref:(northern house mosquito) hypothetical protein n=1 Tax=Culex pipiens TaxID=7175 RepID=A0A8D8HWJ9_CULPI
MSDNILNILIQIVGCVSYQSVQHPEHKPKNAQHHRHHQQERQRHLDVPLDDAALHRGARQYHVHQVDRGGHKQEYPVCLQVAHVVRFDSDEQNYAKNNPRDGHQKSNARTGIAFINC